MKKGFCLFGTLVGVLAVILAIMCFGKSTGYYEISQSYGGDAYTGIQNASAQAANNTQDLAEIAKFAGGSILLVSGLLSIAYFGMKFSEDSKTKDKLIGALSKAKESFPSNKQGNSPLHINSAEFESSVSETGNADSQENNTSE